MSKNYNLSYSKNILSLACSALKILNQYNCLANNKTSLFYKIVNSDINDRNLTILSDSLPKDGNSPNIFEALKFLLLSKDSLVAEKVYFSRNISFIREEEIFNKNNDIVIIYDQRSPSIDKDHYENLGFCLTFSINVSETTMIDYTQGVKEVTEWKFYQKSHPGYIYCFWRINSQASQQQFNEESKEIMQSHSPRTLSLNLPNTPINPNYKGLPNLGNTCYLNSVLHILKWTEGFASLIQLSRTPPIPQLFAVLSIMNTTQGIENPLRTLISSLNKTFKDFHIKKNHDAKELFTVLIGEIEENITNLFCIVVHKTLHCHHNERYSIDHAEEITEKFLFLCVPYGDVESYFIRLGEDQWFEGENSLRCKRSNTLKRARISTNKIDFPSNLAIYVPPSESRNENIKTSFIQEDNLYLLYGVIAYNPYILHYFSYVLIENNWIKFDDETVTYEAPRLDFAYLLFYKATFLLAD
ncbi:unnamed protein product [Blepharisma stoltei]|uniref:ubiquitinyl hydrolase 1 n=1 Tax=Blepharisma stoltei TaxID=1481888 RepID=A0AAU9ITH7_9CILI|nr:unnamed protein product [Blepharisma stoltei]